MSLKTKFFITVTAILCFTLILTSCGYIINPFLPVYQRLDKNGVYDPEGIGVLFEGVKYKMYPALKWDVTDNKDIIGYAGSWGTCISTVEGDTERNFIILQDFDSEYPYIPLYRTDKAIPEPSSESVDKMVWYEHIIGKDNTYYSHTVTNKEIIQEFFHDLAEGKKTGQIRPFTKGTEVDSDIYLMSVVCYSSELTCASYNLDFGIYDGKVVCTDLKELYVEVPLDILEKLAGKSLNFN